MEPKDHTQHESVPEHHLRDSVLDRIHADAISMRPRTYFILRVVLAAVLALLVFVVSALLFNFVLFHVGTHGRLPLVAFGAEGILLFLYLFPWPLFLIDIAFMLALWMLIRRSRFVYRNPGLYPIGLLIVLVALLGILVYVHGGVNEAFREQAHQGNLPPGANEFFDPHHSPVGGFPGDAFRGVVTGTTSPGSFTLTVSRPATTTYLVIPEQNAPAWPPLHAGERVIVGGTLVQPGTISAFGLRTLGDPMP